MWIYILQISNSKYFSINTFFGKKYPVMINQIQLQRTIVHFVLYKKKRQNEN